MKKIGTTIALSILLFSCKQENKNTKSETVETKKTETENIVYKKLIENEKLEEFTVSLFQGKDEWDGKVEIKKNGNSEPFIDFKIIGNYAGELSKVKEIAGIVEFEDFNFDGEKEIVIHSNDGIYLFDRKTGKTKDLFLEDEDRENGQKIKNYIFTYRGEYEKNEKEKTLTITGSSGAGNNSEEIYHAESDGSMKLIKKI